MKKTWHDKLLVESKRILSILNNRNPDDTTRITEVITNLEEALAIAKGEKGVC